MEFMKIINKSKTLDKAKVKNTIQVIMMVCFVFVFALSLTTPVMASTTDTDTSSITSSLNTFLDLVTAIVSGLGEIITLWGISEWGISFTSSEGTMQANSLKRIVGGLVMMLAPQILPLLVNTTT